MDRSGGSLLQTRDWVKEDAERFKQFYIATIIVLLLVSGIIEAYFFICCRCCHRIVDSM